MFLTLADEALETVHSNETPNTNVEGRLGPFRKESYAASC